MGAGSYDEAPRSSNSGGGYASAPAAQPSAAPQSSHNERNFEDFDDDIPF
jgi:hypothetical protein